MDRLGKAGLALGYSATVTRRNFRYLMSPEFFDALIARGCIMGWNFLYMPVGRDPDMDLMLTPAERNEFRENILALRKSKPLAALDFWGDSIFVGGLHRGEVVCARQQRGLGRAVHLRALRDAQPQRIARLEEALTAEYFREIQKRQPFNENLLMPCMLIDNPHHSREIVKTWPAPGPPTRARSPCSSSLLRRSTSTRRRSSASTHPCGSAWRRRRTGRDEPPDRSREARSGGGRDGMAETRPKDSYDVVIIGGGPAGLAAAVYTARQGLSTAVIAGELGGQAQWAAQIDNYLGFALISGRELAHNFSSHVDSFDIDTFPGQYVNALVSSGGFFEVYSREGLRLSGRAAIIATGRAPARLAVPGEKELLGRGVSYCATCDAAFFRGQRVAVVGPGESAAEAALQLAALDADVVLVSDQKRLRASPTLVAKLAADAHVELRMECQVTSIAGEERVTAVTLRDGADREVTLPVDGVFIETGSIPAEEFTGGLVQVNGSGEIEVDRSLMTRCPGVFAAGDVTDQLGKQVIIAAGDGARAGVAAAKWLQRQ